MLWCYKCQYHTMKQAVQHKFNTALPQHLFSEPEWQKRRKYLS